MTQFRNKIIPKVLSEFSALGFVFFMIPVIYIFELSVVLPKVYPFDEKSFNFWFYFHYFCGSFVMFNLMSNLIAVLFIDTSIKTVLVNVQQAKPENGWHYCASCETLSPPRSWHCHQCDTCILKREHHCTFTGCCVGFRNFRYFYMFLFHLFIATFYASYFNHHFVWSLIEEVSWTHLVRLVMPVTVLLLGIDVSLTQLYMFYYSVTLIGGCFVFIILYQQTLLLLKNQTSYEKAKGVVKYNCNLIENLREGLGVRWYLSWISPFVKSPLPHAGVNWLTVGTYGEESEKSK